MSGNIRALFRRIVPRPALIGAWAQYSRAKARRARQVFESAPTSPQWLGRDELERLQAAYPLQEQSYCYDKASSERRARSRAGELIAMADKAWSMDSFLELGSSDGIVCSHLHERGKTAVGIDYRIDRYNKKAARSGIVLAGMDASRLGFRDGSFDFVFSYNSFEHFREPDVVLKEAARVVRSGGMIYLNFGPIWLTPRGAHQYKAITVPYCECLFPETLLEEFGREHALNLVDFAQMNKWTLSQYRDLWSDWSDRLKLVAYYETLNADHVDLIVRYPSCFRSKTAVFDDLIVSNIEALFVKR